MTTRALSASETATSYAAALASGSSKPLPAPKVEVSPAVPAMAVTNGAPEPVAGTSAHRSTPTGSRSKSTAPPSSAASSSTSAPEVSALGIHPNTKNDDDSASAAAAAVALHEEKSNGWEGNSQASSHPDSKSSGAESSRASDYVQPTVTVNIWQKRQEELARKSVSPVIPASVSPAPVQKVASDKGSFAGKKSATTDEKKDVEVKKGSDEASTKRGNRRGQSQENDTTLSLPPPVTDTVSWPTPDLAQGEFKKEKDEKDRNTPAAGRGGTKTWLPVAIDAPYVPPIQTKNGRGGGRGGRGGGRGGAAGFSDRPERINGSGQAAAASGPLEGERGRQYSSRGTYQGGKGMKRTSSPGGAVQRRESKAGVTNGSAERRKEGVDWTAEGSGSGVASGAVQTERSRPTRATEDATYGGASHRQALEDQDKAYGSGYGYSARPERGSHWHNGGGRGETESANTYPPRERGSERGRGGYRGRGAYYGQFTNGPHSAAAGFQGHSNNPTSPPFATLAVNAQQYSQHPQLRVGSFRARGHSGYSSHSYRFNPVLQAPPPPQFAYGGAGLPYDYAMMPGMPTVDIRALIAQINYYFSVDNLIKDMYLRQHMDNDGYVRLSFIMGFQRVQLHTKDINVLRDACLDSPEIQLMYGVDDYYVRKKEGWENWVLKEADRDDSAKRGMSDWHIDPRQRQQQNGSTLTPPGEMSASAEPFFPGAPGMGGPFYPQPIITAFGYQPPASTLSATVPEFSPSTNIAQQGMDGNFNASVPMRPADECTDAEVDALIVVVKRPSTGESGAVHTNGMSDIGARLRKASLSNGDGAQEESGRTTQTSAHGVDPNMTHRSYTEVRAQAIKHRETNGVVKNNDLITLYKFWSHFLVKRFNTAMYHDFKSFALQDADSAVRCGIEELFKMYECSFKDRSTIGYEVISDFVELVKAEARHGESFGTEKLKSILANPSLKGDYRNVIESLIDNETRIFLSQGIDKRGSHSDIYKAAPMPS